MLEELELLKKDWKKQESSLPKLSAQEIYPMLLKKSSSITKWILIISIIEFVFWLLLTTIPFDPDAVTFVEAHHLDTFNSINIALQFSGLVFFIGWFYYNYRKIRTTDSAAVLMHNILNTRKTIKYYIAFNLSLLAFSLLFVFGFIVLYKPEQYANFSTGKLLLIFSIIACVVLVLMWGFYRIIYGILSKRLKKNYKELQKIEY